MILTSKQAHFWERYALNVNDITDKKKDPDGMKHFEERVLNVITGEGSKDKETIGPAVDWKLFNGDCDDTRVIFMSPLDDNSDITPKYKKKLNLIKEAVKKKLPEAKFGDDHYYKRLVYWHVGNDQFEGPDAHLIDKTERGISLFQ